MRIGIGIVWREAEPEGARQGFRQVLVARRLDSARHAAGLREFPGGKVEGRESPSECVAREVREETGLQVVVGVPYAVVLWAYPERSVELHAFDCLILSGVARAIESKSIEWIAPRDLKPEDFPKANASLLDEIARRHA